MFCNLAQIIGKLQISFGIAEVLLGIVAIIIQGWFAYFATPIWMALLVSYWCVDIVCWEPEGASYLLFRSAV